MQRWRREDPYEGPGGEPSEALPLLLFSLTLSLDIRIFLSVDCIQIVIW